MAAFSRSKEEGVGFAKVIAPGNKVDLDEAEVVRYFGNDPETHVIAMLLESISDGAAFLDAVRAVTSIKPVIVLKTGRNKTAQRAAGSQRLRSPATTGSRRPRSVRPECGWSRTD